MGCWGVSRLSLYGEVYRVPILEGVKVLVFFFSGNGEKAVIFRVLFGFFEVREILTKKDSTGDIER